MSDTIIPDAPAQPTLTLTLTDAYSNESIKININPEKTIFELKTELRSLLKNPDGDLVIQNEGCDLQDSNKICHITNPSGEKSILYFFNPKATETQNERPATFAEGNITEANGAEDIEVETSAKGPD
jgi:hypothetical protein